MGVVLRELRQSGRNGGLICRLDLADIYGQSVLLEDVLLENSQMIRILCLFNNVIIFLKKLCKAEFSINSFFHFNLIRCILNLRYVWLDLQNAYLVSRSVRLEQIVDRRIRDIIQISVNQCGFLDGMSPKTRLSASGYLPFPEESSADASRYVDGVSLLCRRTTWFALSQFGSCDIQQPNACSCFALMM